MIESIKAISLLLLAEKFGLEGNLEESVLEFSKESPESFISLLVESPEVGDTFFSISNHKSQPDTAVLEIREVSKSTLSKLPFINQPPRAGAIGPLIKRTFTKGKAGPSIGTRKKTIDNLLAHALSGKRWASYFQRAHDCCLATKISIEGREAVPSPNGALIDAVDLIDARETVLIAYQDDNGQLPGEVKEYVQFLMASLVAKKYVTQDTPAEYNGKCGLCARTEHPVYANGLSGAGVNFSNKAHPWSFPSNDIEIAWKRFCLCEYCANLIYIFANQFRNDFMSSIGGGKCLVIPSISYLPKNQKRFVSRFKKWVQSLELSSGKISGRESSLLNEFANNNAVTSITILWAKFGQNIDDVKRVISEVLPSKLCHLEKTNLAFEKIEHPAFPQYELDGFRINLTLDFLFDLFKRPGGKKAKEENKSKRLFDLRTSVVEAAYHSVNIEQTRIKLRFDDELLKTARWYLLDVLDDGYWPSLVYEGGPKRKNATFAGWIRHLAKNFVLLKNDWSTAYARCRRNLQTRAGIAQTVLYSGDRN